MSSESSLGGQDRMSLTSTAGAPFAFAVELRSARPDAPSRMLRITGPLSGTDAVGTRDYPVPTISHHAYLDAFERIARDFGTRMPLNREPRPPQPFEAPYQVLLAENLAPGMLYGYGDPAVLRIEHASCGDARACYYLLVTSNDAPDSFPILRSTDLRHWQPKGYVFARGSKPRWAADGEYVSDFWAPELHRVGDEFRVYFTARERASGELAIGVAKSSRPDGPFEAADAPMLSGGVIDSHLLIDHFGQTYLFWKEDTNDVWPSRLTELLHQRHDLLRTLFATDQDLRTACLIQALWPWLRTLAPMERFFAQQVLIEAVTSRFSAFEQQLAQLRDAQQAAPASDAIGSVLQAMKTPIYAQRLAPDGLSLVGERTAVLQNDRAWEAHLIEGVWVAPAQGKYYLFYAGNDFSTADYGIGVAIADAPLGPYTKMDQPLLRSGSQWAGPGHPSVAMGLDGQPLLFLHAFFPGRMGYKEFRALLAVPIAFQADRVALRNVANV